MLVVARIVCSVVSCKANIGGLHAIFVKLRDQLGCDSQGYAVSAEVLQ